MSEYVLEVRNITKRFPGVLANDNISLQLEKGKILAILGENGAGKSTLMNIIYGLYDPDEGQIFLNGEEVKIENPHDAIDRGIGMVHQHFMLVPVFTALENIVLGSETTNGPTLDLASARKEVLKISEQYGLPIDPDEVIEDMPVGLQQRVEIIKALYRKADILVLDEPTAVLTPQEADDLFEVMRSLVNQGKSIIFITHKLREVLDVSDTIIVIRNGKVVGSTVPAEANTATLASMMVGREVVLQVEKSKAEAGDVVLDVKDLVVRDERDQVTVNEVSFTVRQGEILGVAGVQGNGQTELVEALTGLR
ncbi:MAG TPA: ATP-binding cassette domain-containing protein, partial [Anaerolineales bacterium]|nr:ATP-binding cassette domain-containing protein [Anaerolineales bacterium]